MKSQASAVALSLLLSACASSGPDRGDAGAAGRAGPNGPGRISLEGCTTSPAELDALPGDLIRHRALRRDDFRGREAAAGMANLAVAGERGAQVGLTILCSAGIRVEQLPDGHFEARLSRLRYFALLDRRQSWWNDEATHISPEWTLRHEQLHFDLAELEARKLNARRAEAIDATRGRATAPEQAVADLQRRWRRHMQQVHERLTEVERRYDRETRHGLELAKQTEWFVRGKRALQESRSRAGENQSD